MQKVVQIDVSRVRKKKRIQIKVVLKGWKVIETVSVERKNEKIRWIAKDV